MVRILVWNPSSVSFGKIRLLEKYSRKLDIINPHSKTQELIIYPKEDSKSLWMLKRILNLRKNFIGLEYTILMDKVIPEKRLDDSKQLMRKKTVKKPRKKTVKKHDNELTMNEKMIEQFLEDRELSERSKKDYRQILTQFVKRYGISLSGLTIEDILIHLRKLNQKGLSQSTILNHQNILRYFLMWNVNKIIRKHITAFLDKYKIKTLAHN